jgi:NADH-quinone oxidoreductase subunit M
LNPKWSAFRDLTWKERLIVLPATALMFLIGIYPQVVIGKVNATVMFIVDQFKY